MEVGAGQAGIRRDAGDDQPNGVHDAARRIATGFAAIAVPGRVVGVVPPPPVLRPMPLVGLPDAQQGEVVAAFLRSKPGQGIDQEPRVDYMRQHLPPHKTPRFWFELEACPLTGSGLVKKFKLRGRWQAGEFREV